MALIKTAQSHLNTIATVVGLIVPFAVLAYVVVRALDGIGTASTGLCHDPPLRTGSISQLGVVAVCVAGFVAGYIVSWAAVRVRSELGERLGEGTKSDRRTVIAVKTALALFLALLSALMALEAIMLQSGIWPITWYVRCAAEANTYVAMLGAATFTFLAGRWLWITR